jgi:putative ABC transport system substrate-binding protein
MAALRAGLTKLGWVEDRNLRVEIRHGSFDPDLMRTYAAELIRFGPDLIIATSALATRTLQQQTQIIPIVFTAGSDPLGSNFVASLARPGGNITGFSNLFPSIASKWVELLKEAVPNLARVALVFDNRNDNGAHRYVVEAEAARRGAGLPTVRILNRNAVEAVHGIDTFAAEPNGGLVLLPPTPNRDTIAQLAAHQPSIPLGKIPSRAA